MHLLTHALAGWCLGHRFAPSPKERVLCVGFSLLPDLDGLSILGGVQAYYDYHHVFIHNALVGGLAAVLVTRAFRCPWRTAPLLFALFHVHLLMDLYGSGTNWGLAYFWPFSAREFLTPHAWELDDWKNLLALAVFMIWTLWIAWRRKSTPLELIAPHWHHAVLARLRIEPKL